MKIDTIQERPGSLLLTLTGSDVGYLRMALERATFLDTPPQYQRAIYDFAEDLLHRLEALERKEGNRQTPG